MQLHTLQDELTVKFTKEEEELSVKVARNMNTQVAAATRLLVTRRLLLSLICAYSTVQGLATES